MVCAVMWCLRNSRRSLRQEECCGTVLETHPDRKAQESTSDLLLPPLCWWSRSCFFTHADQTSIMQCVFCLFFSIMTFAEDTHLYNFHQFLFFVCADCAFCGPPTCSSTFLRCQDFPGFPSAFWHHRAQTCLEACTGGEVFFLFLRVAHLSSLHNLSGSEWKEKKKKNFCTILTLFVHTDLCCRGNLSSWES